MRYISLETLKILKNDSFMRKCCLCGSDRPQWHHNLIHAGRQVDEAFSILPVCKPCHDQADNREVRAKLDRIMVERAGDKIKKYEVVKKYN